jgi:hypothetical protein
MIDSALGQVPINFNPATLLVVDLGVDRNANNHPSQLRRQATVSASTTEAEYIAIRETGREIMWLRELLDTLGYRQPTTTLHCDNQGVIALTQKPSCTPENEACCNLAPPNTPVGRYGNGTTRVHGVNGAEGRYTHQVTSGTSARSLCTDVEHVKTSNESRRARDVPFHQERDPTRQMERSISRGSVSMLEQWQCAQHRMRTVRRRIYAAHLTVCKGIIEQLEQVEIDAFPTAFVICVPLRNPTFQARRVSIHLRPSVQSPPPHTLWRDQCEENPAFRRRGGYEGSVSGRGDRVMIQSDFWERSLT